MGLDVVDHHLELGQLNLYDLGIAEHRLESIQSLVGPLDPDKQLVEGVLELSQTEEGLLQLLLPVVDGLIEFVPTAVDIGQGFLDGAGLAGGGLLGQVTGLSVYGNGEGKEKKGIINLLLMIYYDWVVRK